MDFFPIFLDLRDKACMVVGGSETAVRKAALLLKAGARLTVVASELAPGFAQIGPQENLMHRTGPFVEDMLAGKVLVISCSGDRELDARVSAAARDRGIPVNVVDAPDLCGFIMPSIIDRSPLVVAVSSGGASPVLARLLRARLETLIPAAYGRLASLAARFRGEVRKRFPVAEKRRMFWEKVFAGPVAEQMFAGCDEAAAALLSRMLESPELPTEVGEVYLVGAGPGNPDLLTFRALRLMQQADVCVHDALVSDEVLDLVRRDAERIYVGKQRAAHALPQEDINLLLVRLAREGKRVLRLKGGDPFIFGRGGEEIETLASHGVPFQIVPGITAAAGVASYSGIPLTHRDHAQSVVFVTGHLKDDRINLDWDRLAKVNQTIVIYMGLMGLPVIARELVAHGLSPDTPAAIVQQGTTMNQKVVTGTLATLPALAEAAHLRAPTLIIVGSVVKLHDKLAWFKPEGAVDGPGSFLAGPAASEAVQVSG
jgi:uroporphyrin-III C-methyltransferase / precorrin-2 dehydrogenase / sirohydrochlorin ferrochelatase